ncbi:hypothetical protein IIC65_08785 [Candidatus Sumerlaeota bacterium]|nr:hypothetical protein [Candidatus Sumerlaeota bacterium]
MIKRFLIAGILLIAVGFVLYLLVLPGSRMRTVSSRGVDTSKMTVIPGQGAGEIKFGMTVDELLATLGDPDVIDRGYYKFISHGMEVVAGRDGVGIIILHGSELAAFRYRRIPNFYLPWNVILYEPFLGRTDLGIGIGSTRQTVLNAYGKPDRSSSALIDLTRSMGYHQPPISFSFDSAGRVDMIMLMHGTEESRAHPD